MELYRYADPVMGPRTMPSADWRTGRVKMEANSKLEVDVKGGKVSVTSNGSAAVELGSQIAYVIL